MVIPLFALAISRTVHVVATVPRTSVQEFGGDGPQRVNPHHLEDRPETVKQIMESGQQACQSLVCYWLIGTGHDRTLGL